MPIMGDVMKTQMQELKELLAFGYGLGNAVGAALEDGKIEIREATLLIPVAMTAPEAFSGAGEGIEAFKNLTETQATELKDHLKSTFDIPQDEVEEKFEAALGLAIDVWTRVKVFIKKSA